MKKSSCRCQSVVLWTRCLAVLPACLLNISGLALPAQVQSSTNSISFQGALNGADGKPLPNGNNYNLTFAFYDVSAGGTALATSNVPNVSVINGIASTPVEVDAATFNGETRYLGISINNGPELSPRVLITAVPYSVRAGSAVMLAIPGTTQSALSVASNGNLFATNGIYARSPDGTHAPFSVMIPYDVSVPAPNWLRSGVDAEYHWAVGSPYAPGTGMGFVVGDQIQSTVISFARPAGRSCFQVRSVDTDRGESPVGPNSDVWLTVRHGGVGVHTPEPQSELDVNGTTTTKILKITGGADLAEHLNVTATQPDDEFKVEPGMVVSIDPTGNRKFKLSDEAYDRKRVGIISGGNGVQPGLILRDEGNPQADGEQPIALTGQVWCRADTAFGAITPGDLLTTSSTSGHAMKVTDDTKARFAVLGQALTGLKEGRGWVQVLVGKQ